MTRRTPRFHAAAATALLLGSVLGQTEPAVAWHRLELPSVRGAMAPEVTATSNGALLTWLEPVEATPGAFALRLRPYRDGRFDEARSVTEGSSLFVNWADFPSAVVAGDGSWFVHWLRRGGRRQYGIELAHRPVDALGFTSLGHPHRVGIHGEHGFVSMLAEDAGVRIFWLDGRDYEEHKRMQLRCTTVVGDQFSDEQVLDPDVCTCCQTSAVMTAAGPLVVYRGHTGEEVRDILIVRRQGNGWTSPQTVADDHWVVPGCPVNGPAVAVAGQHVTVAWYTGAKDGTGVRIAFSADAGATFAKPKWVDRNAPIGRVDIASTERGFLLAWLAADGDHVAVRTQEWSVADGPGAVRDVARVQASRDSGFPRLAATPNGPLLVWTEASGICAARLGHLGR
ncbi:MAG: hypothetical protein ABIP94_08785 [Planctomycetota bacterium]